MSRTRWYQVGFSKRSSVHLAWIVIVKGSLCSCGTLWTVKWPTYLPAYLPTYLNSAGAGSHGSRGSGSYGGSYGDGYNGGYARVQLPGSEMRIGPGLSAYAPSGSSAGQSLKPLLEYARQQVRAHTEKGIVADSRCRYTCRSELGQVELRS